MKNYIIYWMRGVWKTFYWKKVANILWINFIDLDKYMEEKVWEKLFEYIERNWWDKFRDLENKTLKEVLNLDEDKIISLWWWTICFERNQKEILKNNFKLIYIDAYIQLIKKSVLSSQENWNKRNSLTWKNLEEELEEVFTERKEIYEKFYDYKVVNKNWKWVEEKILEKINYWGVCIPITDFSKETIVEKFKEIEKAKEIKFVELRIDFLESKEELSDIISLCPRKVIVTNRSHLETWNFKWKPEESRKILEKASKYWADFVDYELINWEEEIRKLKDNLNPKTKLILSFHDFEKTPSVELIEEKIEEMKRLWADICKIAVMPCSNGKSENGKMVKLENGLIFPNTENLSSKNYQLKTILISMWKLWEITRIENAKRWQLLTFWCFGWEESAPWQINYKKLHKEIY